MSDTQRTTKLFDRTLSRFDVMEIITYILLNYNTKKNTRSLNSGTKKRWSHKPMLPSHYYLYKFALTLHTYFPVEPNPPTPRTVSLSSATSSNSTLKNGTTTNWATFCPGLISRTTSPSLWSATFTSPR